MDHESAATERSSSEIRSAVVRARACETSESSGANRIPAMFEGRRRGERETLGLIKRASGETKMKQERGGLASPHVRLLKIRFLKIFLFSRIKNNNYKSVEKGITGRQNHT